MQAPRTTLFVLSIAAALTVAPSVSRADDEGAIRNSTPLPAHRSAEESLAAGDASWAKAADADPRDRATPRNQAFDAWREALLNSTSGDGVRLDLTDVSGGVEGAAASPFPSRDPYGTNARRSEGVGEAVVRRLGALSPEDRGEWQRRFGTLASSAWERARTAGTSPTGDPAETYRSLSTLERNYPFTEHGFRASLALFDLEVEAGQPVAAGAWLTRAARHSEGLPKDARWEAAIDVRHQVLDATLAQRSGQDHTEPPPRAIAPDPTAPSAGAQPPSNQTSPIPRLVTTQRLSGITRRSDEPFGLGLSTGIAFFSDGAAVVQGAHGILSLIPTEDGDRIALRPTGAVRSLYQELFGIHQPVARAAPSAGGWPSLPASDGSRVAMVMGRGEPARSFRDVEIAAVGNTLGVCSQGPTDRPLKPLWVLRDGLIALDPSGPSSNRRSDSEAFGALSDVFSRSGKPLTNWDLGPGWEFQPGPVMADNKVFVLARGLGGGDESSEDRTDEVRLIALDALTGTVHWSVSVTKERGHLDGNARGEAGYYAATTMPLNIHRPSGTILVGTNSGLLAAFGAAEGRLLWAFRNQRRTVDEGGWPGSRPPMLIDDGPTTTAWFTPFDSSFAYPLPAGPAPINGSFLAEAPRVRGNALDLAAISPQGALAATQPAEGTQGTDEASTLILLGRYARYSSLLVDAPGKVRQPAACLAPSDRFGGIAALNASGTELWAAGTAELSAFAAANDFSLVQAAPMTSQGAGTGGDIVRRQNFLYVLGRDTVWVYALPN
jgi:hypothetical protein